jgi:PKD repeat protein
MKSRNLFFLWLLSLLVWAACSSEIERPRADPKGPGGEVAIGAVIQLDGSASSDPNGLALTFNWAFVEIPAGSTAKLQAPQTSKPYFTVDKPGTYRASLIVSNGVSSSDTAFVNVKAGKCGGNNPAVDKITATPATPNVGEVIALTAAVTHDDEKDPCKLTRTKKYEWTLTQAPAGSASELVAADTEAPWLKADKGGDYTVSLVVTDDLGHKSETKTLTIKVGTCGSNPPVVKDDKIDVKPNDAPAVGVTVQLGVTVTDADTDMPCGKSEAFSYLWTIQAAPAGSKVQLNLATAQNPSFVIDKEGKYTVRVVVKDGAGNTSNSVTKDINASKCGSNPPTVAAITQAPANAALGKPVQLSIAQADLVDSDTLPECGLTETFSYAWQILSLPSGSKASLNSASSTNPSFTPDVGGDYIVGLVVSDTAGHPSALVTKKITVTACGSNVPSVTAIVANPTTPNANDVTQLTATVTDADFAAPCKEPPAPPEVSYSWILAATPQGSKAKLSSASSANPSFKPDVVGDYTFTLVVTDAEGHSSAIKTQKISTTTCGASVPTAVISKIAPAGNPPPDSTVQLDAHISVDLDNKNLQNNCDLKQSFTYEWFFLKLPAGNQAKFNNASVFNPSFGTGNAKSGNVFEIGLIVTDSTGLSSSVGSMTITVQ